MALKGNLHDFSTTQILNLVNIAKKSGTLYVEGASDEARVCFRYGQLSYLQIGQQQKSLLKVLQEYKKISASQFNLLSSRLGNLSDKETGLYLVNGGYINQDGIFDVLEKYLTDQARGLLTWSDGFFHFEPGELTPDDKIPAKVNLENLIVEGARALHELEELKAEIPSLDMALRFTERPGTDIRNVNLSDQEWQVVQYVNPKNSIQQIANTTHLDELEIRRVVYALLQAGLVELIRPDGVPVPVRGKQQIQPFDIKGQRGLVNRLIERIRSI
jgi:hypothetical protein